MSALQKAYERWYALNTWMAPSIVCARPKRIVSRTIKIATQKVNHRSPFRRSFHIVSVSWDLIHQRLSWGWRVARASNWIYGSGVGQRWDYRTFVLWSRETTPGIVRSACFLRNQALVFLSDSGKRSARVFNVSSINSSSYMSLWRRL